MGLWSFVKDAGKSLFGSSAEAAEAPAEDVLKKEISDLGLDASGLDITVEGDKVKVSGAAVSQEMKEKVILAVGNVEGVAEGAVLDPAADSGFVDPGDDDLAVPSGLEAPEATQILSSPFESVGVVDDDEDYEEEYEEEYEEDEEEEAIASPESFATYEDGFDDRDDDLLSPEPIDPEPIAVEASPIPDPNRARMDPIDARMPEEAAPVDPSPGRQADLGFSEPEPAAAALAEPEPVATSFYEPEPARAAFTEPDPITEPIAEPPTAATILPDPEATAAAVLAQVAPELRAQLHDTLERIAWEAFGQVTEKLVKQAIDRVEKAAWEVVPKLAETLILEEIRKLKGE